MTQNNSAANSIDIRSFKTPASIAFHYYNTYGTYKYMVDVTQKAEFAFRFGGSSGSSYVEPNHTPGWNIVHYKARQL